MAIHQELSGYSSKSQNLEILLKSAEKFLEATQPEMISITENSSPPVEKKGEFSNKI